MQNLDVIKLIKVSIWALPVCRSYQHLLHDAKMNKNITFS